jgi:hypothetical protein
MEDRAHHHRRLEHQHRLQRHAEQQDHRHPHQGRQHHLAEVKPQRAGAVQHLVEVVDAVEAPQERDLVVGAMPPIDPQIQQDEIEHQAGPAAPPARPQPQVMEVGPGGDRHHHQRREQQVDAEQPQVAGEPAPGRGRRPAQTQQQRAVDRRP